MKILHVTPSFYPATSYGGPVFSTYALCNALAADPRVQLRVLTTDTAGPKASQRLDVKSFPTSYPPGYPVFFTRRVLATSVAPGLLARLWSMIGWADVVHLTATYSFPTIPTLALARLRRRPVLWSPRGALLASHTWDDVSRQQVKRIWEKICQAVASDRTLLHVTSEEEKAASLARMPGLRAIVIPNGIDIPTPVPPRRWQPDGVLRLMFLGRIDPVKAIENLIEGLALLEQRSVRLDVYGTGAADYIDGLKRLAASKQLGDIVHFHGHVEGESKRQAFAEADVCVLPSFSENFSMVVAEALAHGVPTSQAGELHGRRSSSGDAADGWTILPRRLQPQSRRCGMRTSHRWGPLGGNGCRPTSIGDQMAARTLEAKEIARSLARSSALLDPARAASRWVADP